MRLCVFTDELSLDFAAALRTCAENGIDEAYAQARGPIVDVQVRDAAPDPANRAKHGPIVRFGEGAIDWASMLGRLVADRYGGTLTLETHLYSQDPDRWTKLPAASMHAAAELRKLMAGAGGQGPSAHAE